LPDGNCKPCEKLELTGLYLEFNAPGTSSPGNIWALSRLRRSNPGRPWSEVGHLCPVADGQTLADRCLIQSISRWSATWTQFCSPKTRVFSAVAPTESVPISIPAQMTATIVWILTLPLMHCVRGEICPLGNCWFARDSVNVAHD
jgi:hypothetical protein